MPSQNIFLIVAENKPETLTHNQAAKNYVSKIIINIRNQAIKTR